MTPAQIDRMEMGEEGDFEALEALEKDREGMDR